jgi:hypothetical protein
MKDTGSLHQKVQEHIDCQATTDPLKGMSEIVNETDQEEGALKWLALAALHGVTQNAKKISLSTSADGQVEVTAKYRRAQLPSPGPAIGGKVIQALRTITHITEKKGKMPLALGIRDGSVELRVKVKSKDGREEITLKFPE